MPKRLPKPRIARKKPRKAVKKVKSARQRRLEAEIASNRARVADPVLDREERERLGSRKYLHSNYGSIYGSHLRVL